MRFDELNDDNYMMFAIKHYENPQAVTQEDFYEDLKKFKYIKRLLKRYKNTGELIRKLPGDAVLRIARQLESMKGVVFDQKF